VFVPVDHRLFGTVVIREPCLELVELRFEPLDFGFRLPIFFA